MNKTYNLSATSEVLNLIKDYLIFFFSRRNIIYFSKIVKLLQSCNIVVSLEAIQKANKTWCCIERKGVFIEMEMGQTYKEGQGLPSNLRAVRKRGTGGWEKKR